MKGNGIYHLNVELEPHMIGRGELCIFDESQVLIFKESPFKYKCYSQTRKKLMSLRCLLVLTVEQLAAFDRYTGIPIIVNIKNNSTTKSEGFENRYIRSILSASILPLPNEGKIVDGNESLPELDVGKTEHLFHLLTAMEFFRCHRTLNWSMGIAPITQTQKFVMLLQEMENLSCL